MSAMSAAAQTASVVWPERKLQSPAQPEPSRDTGTDEDCLEEMVRGNRKRAEKPCCIMMGPGVVPGRYQGLRLIDEAQTAMKLAGIPFDEDMLDGRSFF